MYLLENKIKTLVVYDTLYKSCNCLTEFVALFSTFTMYTRNQYLDELVSTSRRLAAVMLVLPKDGSCETHC
jgi:hypothetical protein